MLISIYYWENLLMDSVTRLLILINWKSEMYNWILVIINQLTKMIYYKSIKVTIDNSGLVKVIIGVIIWYHSFSDFIINDWRSVFISKVWFSLYYFFGIKCYLFTTIQSQINSQTECEKSIMKAYFRVFVNFK